MDWKNILQAICSAPAIILDKIVSDLHDFWIEERELVKNGEFDAEEIKEEQNKLQE